MYYVMFKYTDIRKSAVIYDIIIIVNIIINNIYDRQWCKDMIRSRVKGPPIRLSYTIHHKIQWEDKRKQCVGNYGFCHHYRHNERDGVSNHRGLHCLLYCWFSRRSKKTSNLRVSGLCVGYSPMTVNSPHKGPVSRKMFPFDDVIMALPGVEPRAFLCSILYSFVISAGHFITAVRTGIFLLDIAHHLCHCDHIALS